MSVRHAPVRAPAVFRRRRWSIASAVATPRPSLDRTPLPELTLQACVVGLQSMHGGFAGNHCWTFAVCHRNSSAASIGRQHRRPMDELELINAAARRVPEVTSIRREKDARCVALLA